MRACADALMATLAAVLLLPAGLVSQGDTSARLQGFAISSVNGRPLKGVMIAVPAARRFAVTDSTGAFSMTGLPGGLQMIRVSYLDHETDEYPFNLESGRTVKIEVLLDADAYDLAPLVVEVQHPDRWRDLGGFFARKDWYQGYARFWTREEIGKIQPPSISALLVAEHIVTRCIEGCRPTRFSRGRLCFVPVSVDGMPFRDEDYDRISIRDVAGIEVYRRISPYGLSYGLQIAPAFSSVWQPDAFACGSVLIWTR